MGNKEFIPPNAWRVFARCRTAIPKREGRPERRPQLIHSPTEVCCSSSFRADRKPDIILRQHAQQGVNDNNNTRQRAPGQIYACRWKRHPGTSNSLVGNKGRPGHTQRNTTFGKHLAPLSIPVSVHHPAQHLGARSLWGRSTVWQRALIMSGFAPYRCAFGTVFSR